MLNALKTEANYTTTENGALTYASTMDYCLDLFATAGGLREASEEKIINMFVRSYAENADLAMKLLFFIRDIREGLGERRFFRVVLKNLCFEHASSVVKNLEWIAEFGRFDDFLVLIDTPCEQAAVSFLKAQLDRDMESLRGEGDGSISLLAKWLPSANTSSRETVRLAKKLIKAFGMSEKEYRKTLSALRGRIDIIEDRLRRRDYTFDYEKQPSKAMLKYTNAFCTNDRARYSEYLRKVMNHEATMHTSTLMPYEIVRPFVLGDVSDEEALALDAIWKAQEDYAGDQNALVVIDGSGSMYNLSRPMPATVAQSLGLYFAERNTGYFANHFITFSTRPQLIEIKGRDLAEKLDYICTFNEVADTNIQAVFELILAAAVKNHVPKEQMPEKIYIISDMEFNWCVTDCDMTNFEYAKRIFEEAGYKLPHVVFWNVACREMQAPVEQHEEGVTLVSGCSARLFKMVLSDHIDPLDFMLQTLGSERYEKIVA